MLRKAISLLLIVCMAFCLSACATKETNSSSDDTPSASQTEASQNVGGITSTGSDNSQATSNTEAKAGKDSPQGKQDNESESNSAAEHPAHIHSYANATCISPKKCSCGATAGTALGHQFTAATCTSPQICSRCGITSGSALGHNYLPATCNSPKTCKRCGQKTGNALGHTYVQGKCTACGTIDPDWQRALFDLDPFDASDMFEKSGDLYDTYGNFYDKLLLFGDMKAWFVNRPEATYRIANKYSRFSGTISYWDTTKTRDDGDRYMQGNLTIKIYKDDNMVYMKDNITKWTEPIKFDLDITGCNFLKISVYNTKEDGYAYLILGNALLKK